MWLMFQLGDKWVLKFKHNNDFRLLQWRYALVFLEKDTLAVKVLPQDMYVCV